MFKDILFPITHSDGDNIAMAAAVKLAELQQAHLAVVVPVDFPIPTPADWGMYPYSMYGTFYSEAIKSAELAGEKIRAALKKEIIASEVRVASTPLLNPAQICALHARHADIAVLGGSSKGKRNSSIDAIFTELLMDSGRPVLLIPAGSEPVLPAKRILIAWQPTCESTRALHDAMPFLHTSDSIDVLVIDPKIDDRHHGEQPGADIATHLARHGLNVRVVVQPRMDKKTGETILEYAKQTDAQLIVAGGYSHSRFREQMMGGVTRSLSQNLTIPVLFSH
jgi:nucleotide-binding universal stress UspA family protein